jgi:repeat uncharacterized protein DUF347
MATFALGTAVGDLTAYTLGLGYFTSAVVFAVLIAIPGIAYRWLGLNGIAAFWSAYVLTRPLGASLADWASVPHWRGGLGLGWGPVSMVLAMVIIGMVSYLAVSGKDTCQARARQPGASHGYLTPAYAGRPFPQQPSRERQHREQPDREPAYWQRSHPERPAAGRAGPVPEYPRASPAFAPSAPTPHRPSPPGRPGRPARGGRHRAPRG